MDAPPPKTEATTVTPATPKPAAAAAEPASPAQGGGITTEGSPIESRLLAYHAVRRAAKEIVEDVAKVKPARVVIHDDTDIVAVGVYRAFVTQLAVLLAEVREATKQANDAIGEPGAALESLTVAGITTAISGVGALLQSVMGIVALFRETVTVKSHDVTLGDSALVAAVCGQLVDRNIPVYNPTMVPPGFGSASSALVTNLEALAEARVDLEAALNEAEALKAKLTTEIAEIDQQLLANPNDATLTERRAQRQQRLASATEVATRLTSAAGNVDTFRAALVKVAESTGVTALSRILRAEKIASVLGDAHLLALRASGGGGGLETRESGWMSAAKRFYSGGAIVEFLLFAPDGQVVKAGTLPVYSGLVKVIEGRNAVDLTDVESL